MSDKQPVQAIFQTRYTQIATSAGVPSKETRQALAKYGFEYRNGNWIKSESNSSVVTETEVAQQVAA